MKQYGIMLFVIALWCAFLPAAGLLPNEAAALEAESAAEVSTESIEQAGEVTVFLKGSNAVKRLPLEEYVALALGAVMAPDSPPEAMKAQAVAIRSLALYAAAEGVHEDYDLCDSHLHCQPVADTAEAAHYRAAEETAGMVLLYDGSAAFTPSHLSSCLSTEPYGEGFPYLTKAEVRDESGFECYRTEYCYKEDAFAHALQGLGCDLDGDYGEWVGEAEFTEGSRVRYITVGGAALKGEVFAARLGLDSLCFTVRADSKGFTVICYGSGSGYGMSRCSAVLMAAEGMDAEDILAHFYPETELCKI